MRRIQRAKEIEDMSSRVSKTSMKINFIQKWRWDLFTEGHQNVRLRTSARSRLVQEPPSQKMHQAHPKKPCKNPVTPISFKLSQHQIGKATNFFRQCNFYIQIGQRWGAHTNTPTPALKSVLSSVFIFTNMIGRKYCCIAVLFSARLITSELFEYSFHRKILCQLFCLEIFFEKSTALLFSFGFSFFCFVMQKCLVLYGCIYKNIKTNPGNIKT